MSLRFLQTSSCFILDLGAKDVVNYIFLYLKLSNNLLPPSLKLLTFLQLILNIEHQGRPRRMFKLFADIVIHVLAPDKV